MKEVSLLKQIGNPEVLKTMSTSDKFMGALEVTLQGMLITFIALVGLWGLILLQKKIVELIENKDKVDIKSQKTETSVKESVDVSQAIVDETDDLELVAVISAAIAASMNTSIDNIVVKNITRVQDNTPEWGKVGRIEQLNNRL